MSTISASGSHSAQDRLPSTNSNSSVSCTMDHYPNASSHSSRSSCTGSSSSPAEAPPHSPFNSHIRTSCDACKRLKIKCEKNGDNCAHCLNRGITCVTTLVERKKRQPTRSTSLLDIESRIKRMESVITASGLDTQSNSVAASSPVASESPLASPTKLIDRLSTLVISGEGKTRYFGGESGLTLFSPQGLDWIAEKTGSDELSRFIHTLATDVHTPPEKTATELYRPLFASEREPFPPKHIADRYVDYFFESYNNLSPLYDKAAFDRSYELQYSGDPPKGLAWYASLNIVLCLGCLLLQVRDKNNTSDNPERKVWKKYLRNASGCLLDLIFEEGSLEAVQALVGMAVVHQVHLEPQAVHILVAAAGRLSYGIGLHRDLKDRGISEAEVIQRRNVFWVVYTMDKTVALRLGHPSVMNDDDIGIDLPLQECPHKVQADGTTTRVDMFRYRVQLARLESRVYSKLYSARGQTRSPLERLRLVGELDKTLIDWKEKLPVEIQPEQPIQCPADLVLPTILMHFAYFNCLTIIHRVSIHHGSWTSTHYGRHESTLQDDRYLNPRVYASEAICLAAARQSIKLLKSVDFETRAVDKSSLWMLLYYPLSNLLTLFANTLQNPADPEAPSDLKLMEIVISLLSEPAFHVNVPTANAARLFVELGNVTRKLVEKTNCNIAKPAKRARDEYDHKQDQSQTSEQEPRVPEALSGLENSGQQSGSMLHSASVINNGDNSTNSSLEAHALGDNIQHHTSNMPHPLYPSGTIDDDLFTMSNTPMFFDNAIPLLDATSFTPLMSEYFEWDLANLWNFEQGI